MKLLSTEFTGIFVDDVCEFWGHSIALFVCRPFAGVGQNAHVPWTKIWATTQ